MQSVAKFVTKAYPVSGCFDYLSEVSTDVFLCLESICTAVLVARKAGVTIYSNIETVRQWHLLSNRKSSSRKEKKKLPKNSSQIVKHSHVFKHIYMCVRI